MTGGRAVRPWWQYRRKRPCSDCRVCHRRASDGMFLRACWAVVTLGLSELVYLCRSTCDSCRHRTRLHTVAPGAADATAAVVEPGVPVVNVTVVASEAHKQGAGRVECRRCGAGVQPEMTRCPYCAASLA